MTEPVARRPWWKRTRWAVAGVLWLAVAYPLSTGPVQYAAVRGWVPVEAFSVYCWPPMRGLNNAVGVALGYWDWVLWWDDLARRHAAAD